MLDNLDQSLITIAYYEVQPINLPLKEDLDIVLPGA